MSRPAGLHHRLLAEPDVKLSAHRASVQEVLSRETVFQVTYKQKMEIIGDGANFSLGMQNSPEYERDQSHMRTVIRRQDLTGQVQPLVAKTAENLVSASGGRIDVVQLSRVVPMRLIAMYFGCPADSEGPGPLEHVTVSVSVHRSGKRHGPGRGRARGGGQGSSVVVSDYRRAQKARLAARRRGGSLPGPAKGR